MFQLPLFLFCCFFLLLIHLQHVDGLGSTTTVAIVGNANSPIVCAILAGVDPRSVVCSQAFQRSDHQRQPVMYLAPNSSFLAISGGRDFLCGLWSDSRTIFCWSPTTNFTTKRIYFGPTSFRSISVGEDHVAALSELGGVSFWRGGRSFPANSTSRFKYLTSGDGFSCGIDYVNNNRVTCWGNKNNNTVSERLISEFRYYSMSTLFAGDSHMCGIDNIGLLICRGRNDSGQLGTSNPSDPYEFSTLALGSSHTCGIKRTSGLVVCWGQDGGKGGGEMYLPIGNTSMEEIVAGGNLTCGVTTQNLSLLCWSSEMSFLVQLPQILPGVCTKGNARDVESSCDCGVYPDSQRLCSNSGVICKPCNVPSPSVQPPPQHPQSSPSPPRRYDLNWLLPFIIICSVGVFAGIISVVYCLVIEVFKRKKLHNSVQPTTAGVVTSANPGPTPFNSPSRWRSMSTFLRQSSERMAMRRQRSNAPSSSPHDRLEEFTLRELADATSNFSPEMKIGAGSFGTVYKGKFVNGREVAVKRSGTTTNINRYQEKETAFKSELTILSRLHHKNLVKLIGFCLESDEKLLVYEFMKNGSLHEHLHSSTTSLLLHSLKARLKAVLDASRGIDYLHRFAVPHVIHRDIKSSNILLDSDLTAKVSDFGLAVFDPVPVGVHVNQAGTLGYMDPDYRMSAKNDVYGLGVVMLEAITGKKAVFRDETEGRPISVVEYAVPLILGGDLRMVVDGRLGSVARGEMEAVELVAFTAVDCLKIEGRERPEISAVVASLENALGICASFSSDATISIESMDHSET